MKPLALRRVHPCLHQRTQAVLRWQQAGHDAGLGSPDRRDGFLRFSAQGERGQWQGLIDARQWLNLSLPQLAPLLARECALSNIVELFRAVPRPLRLEPNELRYRTLCAVELIESRTLAADLPWLATSQGTLWLTQLPSAAPTPVDLRAQAWLSDVPHRLELSLGTSALSHASRSRLVPGDVLRITREVRQCWLAQRCIGTFTMTNEGLQMEPRAAEQHPAIPAAAPPDVELHALPVRLEFVLATREVRLDELANIMAGDLITLEADAVQHIEVRANGKTVARGELVQLDEQLGVELLEVYRNLRNE
jgi:type III secretion protein Q